MLQLILKRHSELQEQIQNLKEQYAAAPDGRKKDRIAGQYRKACQCIEPYQDILALSFLDKKGLLIEYFDFMTGAYRHLPAIAAGNKRESKNIIEEIQHMKEKLKNAKSQ